MHLTAEQMDWVKNEQLYMWIPNETFKLNFFDQNVAQYFIFDFFHFIVRSTILVGA